jgi:MSHA biogenesis protein MshK
MAASLKMLASALLLSLIQVAAMAETLPDPTRPAIDLNSTSVSGVSEALPEDQVPHGLQSVIISPQYRAAIINGETVKLGDKSGDSRLVEVRENSVVLQNAHGRRVLELFPKVSMQKNETPQQKGATQDKAPAQSSLPENAAGGMK